jgi:hypothetical protein
VLPPWRSAPESDRRRAKPEAKVRGEVFLGHNTVLIRLAGRYDHGPLSSARSW